MKVLLVGDIVGKPGRVLFTKLVGELRTSGAVDFVIANAENAAAGRGPTPEIAQALIAAGADVIILGDHTWDSKEMVAGIDLEERVIRPANFPKGAPGKGWVRVETPEGPIAVLQVIGRVFMQPHQGCPFVTADRILKGELANDKTIFVDIHAEATSEKMAFGRYLDGRVTSVTGTHTHCQTSDARIFPQGTAFMTDLGMTGPQDSVLGRAVEPVVGKFITGLPHRFDVATGDPALEGALVDVDMTTGRARSIEALRLYPEAE
jgi:metallophosphoesterase (TIGR00282 family)